MPTYEKLKGECLQKGSLYEDPEFPANNSVLYFPDDKPIEWRRPTGIVEKPVFIREATYYDLNQGKLGDCFFLTAVNSLMANDKSQLETVIPKGQSFDKDYAGIFQFKFWQYGDWHEVVIDDRLPVRNGKLLYSRNRKEEDEFWICLLEKAYAKLQGSYENIHGGFTENVLVDLTGGISETIELGNKEYDAEHLFKILAKMWKMDSLISMAIYSKVDQDFEHERDNGLLEGHAYSVTRLAKVSFENRTEKLIRLRNPWGRHEWTGAWSDKSTEWKSFSDADRKVMGLTIREEGEFWMRLEDVMTEFDAFNFCHQDESALIRIVADPDVEKAKWSPHVFRDCWVKNVSSGGSDTEKDIYWRNPQYMIDLEHRTEDTWVVISLMEVMSPGKESDEVFIGFDIFKLKPGVKKPASYRFDKDAVRLRSFVKISLRREKSSCIDLPPGIYVIVVYNKQMVSCDYLMRIYCDCIASVRPADDVTEPFTEEERKEVEDPIKVIFDRYSDKRQKNADADQLKFMLQDIWKAEFQSDFDITLTTCRCLMEFVEPMNHGTLDFPGVKKSFAALLTWMKMFLVFDKDRSLTIEISELANLLEALGIKVGRKVLIAAVFRYGGRNVKIDLDDFLQCICRIFSISKTYKKLGLKDKGVSLADYLSEIIRV